MDQVDEGGPALPFPQTVTVEDLRKWVLYSFQPAVGAVRHQAPRRVISRIPPLCR